MRLTLDDVVFRRDNWSLHASGSLGEGVHLVTGPVGSGKTTLALLIGRVLVPYSGEVLSEDIGSVMLSQQFPEYHTTSATLAGEVSSWGLDPGEVLPAAGLSGRGSDDPFAISRGELKRLHLGCVLAGDHDLLILDEPFSCLDCIGKKMVCDRIQERARGITLVFTHEQWILPRVRELWEIREGRLVGLGRVPEAIRYWRSAPRIIAKLIAAGRLPANISEADIREAACGTQE